MSSRSSMSWTTLTIQAASSIQPSGSHVSIYMNKRQHFCIKTWCLNIWDHLEFTYEMYSAMLK